MLKTKVFNGGIWLESTHTFQQTAKDLSPLNMFRGFFRDLLPTDISTRMVQTQSLGQADVVVFPCVTFDQLIQAIGCVTKYHIKRPVVFSYLRENIDPHEVWPLNIAAQGLKNCTLLVNGFKVDFNFPTVAVDTFLGSELPRISEVPNPNPQPVTIFAGSMQDRLERAYVITRCAESGLMDNIFATYMWDDTIRDNIYALAKGAFDHGKQVIAAIDNGVFKQNLVDGNGAPIVNPADLYNRRWEFDITPQMRDCRLNIALETRPWMHSITEKTYKPLRAGVPHVWMAVKNLLPWLKLQGYTPYPLINYEFDAANNTYDRIDRMVDGPIADVVDGLDPRDPFIADRNKQTVSANSELWNIIPSNDLLRTLLPNRPV